MGTKITNPRIKTTKQTSRRQNSRIKRKDK